MAVLTAYPRSWVFLGCSINIPAANYTLSKVFAGALDFIAVINKVARFQNEVKSVHRANGSSMLSGGN